MTASDPPADDPLGEPDTVEGALVRAARLLTMTLDLASVCDGVIESVHAVFGATSSWILLWDEDSKCLRTAAARGEGSDAFRGLALPPEVGILGLAFRSRQVVFVPTVTEEDRWFDPARVKGSGLRSVFMVPLVYHEQVIGVVGLDSPLFSADRPPTAADRARLEAFAAQAAIAVTNARLFEASERDRQHLRSLLKERRQLRGQVEQLQETVRAACGFGEIAGEDPGFLDVLEQARLVAPGDTTVMILGETGTGKELVARYIHEHSGRASGPFVAVNCAALPEALVESELFGHEKGAFTGALSRKPGKFEIAHRGTLFLDEIGDLPLEAQAKLLRVLQDGLLQRVGSTREMRVDVRVIAATNRDLEKAVADATFRTDLYYRLHVFPLRLPPLRDRPGDVGLLARHFLRHFTAKLGRPGLEFEPAALERLRRHTWPGNVRELQNAVERAVILTRGRRVLVEAIALSGTDSAPYDTGGPAATTLADVERRAILAALEASNWCISGPRGAARALGLKSTTLHARMKKHGIRRPDPQEPVRD